jgi:hypothetical protein
MSPKSDFCQLLLQLHREEGTGIVLTKHAERQLAVYVKGGDIVCAAGIDKESSLLRKIASMKNLSREELTELQHLLVTEPFRLGKTLIERNLISDTAWHRFLETKVRAVVAAALEMENAEVLFKPGKLGILPVNFVLCPVPLLLLEETRKTKNLKVMQKYLVKDQIHFRPSKGRSLKVFLPFTPSEARLLSMLDGEKNWRKLIEETGMTIGELARDLHALFSLGLIEQVPQSHLSDEDLVEYKVIVRLYLSLIRTMKRGFHQESEFQDMVRECLAGATGPVKTLFHDLPLVADDEEAVVLEVLRRFTAFGNLGHRRLILLTAFNKLIYLMLMRVRKRAGKSGVQTMLEQMTKTLIQAEESKEHSDLMRYLLGNLEDYARQMGSL